MGVEGLLNGAELIDKQNCTLKELPSKGLKDFCPTNSWIEKKQTEKKLEEKFNFINAARIEKSNNVSLAEWVPQLGKAKVLKKIGKLWETIGHHQANEDWLLPEEVLFLVENSELQLLMDNICASVEDCYALLLEEKCFSLNEYRVYSYLCRAGLRVVRHSPSVTVTPYEQQVNLDTIFQRHKRSPPHTSKAKLDDNEITIIDEDIDILNKSVAKESETVFSRNHNVNEIEVIEIEDDIDPMPIIQEVLDSSDDSSDIVCVSSPSYICTNKCRQWYPPVQKSLLKSMENIIDLCDDDPPNNFKELIHNQLDLIKMPKADVLALLPSAKNGVSVIHSPDNRLIPNNIVPKYLEYKVNLNVRSDVYSNKFNENYSLMPRIPFTNMKNNSQMNPEFIHNPLMRKSEEMKAMAMDMIQTATTLMSVLTSQNPNELWNFVHGRNQNVTQFTHPRFNFLQHKSYYRFPWKNYRAMRRRYPYGKRYGERYFKRSHESNRYSNNVADHTHHSSEVKMEIVVLSDDEDAINRNDFLTGDLNHEKRKRVYTENNFNKKLKTENNPLDSSVISEDCSINLENKPILNIKTTESEDTKISGINDNEQNIIKEESDCSYHEIKLRESEKKRQAEIETEDNSSEFTIPIITSNINNKNSEIKPNSNKNKLHEHITSSEQYNLENNRNIIVQEISNNIIGDKQIVCEELNCKNALQKKNMLDFDDQDCDVEEGIDKENGSTDSTLEDSNNFISTENNFTKTQPSTNNAFKGKITCWEEFKNRADSQLDVEEMFIEDTKSLIKFEENITYEDILTGLQIFKEAHVTTTKKINIAYDVYLPDASFKKSLKILPNFRVIVSNSNEEMPTPIDLKYLKTEYQDQIPFLFSVVFNETIGFYLYDTMSLPSLFE